MHLSLFFKSGQLYLKRDQTRCIFCVKIDKHSSYQHTPTPDNKKYFLDGTYEWQKEIFKELIVCF